MNRPLSRMALIVAAVAGLTLGVFRRGDERSDVPAVREHLVPAPILGTQVSYVVVNPPH